MDMKLALILIRKSKEAPIILHDDKGKPPPMLMIGWPEQLAALLLVAVAGLWMWFGLIEPALRSPAQPAIRVPRAQQVMSIDAGSALQIGDTVLVAGKVAPKSGTVAALPRQSVRLRDASGTSQFVILGADGYYVIVENGAGQVMSRGDIRGVVQNRL
jgi:hypothetical protein